MLLLLAISIISASLNSVFLHKTKLNDNKSIYKFNLLCSLVWCLVLFIANGCKLQITKNAFAFGVLYGIAQVCFIFFKTQAMNKGPVSITTLVGNSSLVISVVVCFILWDEPITFVDIIGLILLFVGIVLCTYKKSEQKYKKYWKVYVIAFLILSASVGIIFKAYSKTGKQNNVGDMLLVSSIVMLLAYSIVCVFIGSFKGGEVTLDKKEKLIFIRYALISGLLSCLYNRLNIYLCSVLDGVIFFPVFNGGVILLSALLAIRMLNEKLLLRQVLGVLSGILGICLIGVL